jgi:hypothetical protein
VVTGTADVRSVVTAARPVTGRAGRVPIATPAATRAAVTAETVTARAATGATAPTADRPAPGLATTGLRAPAGRRTVGRAVPTARGAARASAGPCPTGSAARSPMRGPQGRPDRLAGAAQALAGRPMARAAGRTGHPGTRPGRVPTVAARRTGEMTGPVVTGPVVNGPVVTGPVVIGIVTTGGEAGRTRPASRTASPTTRSRVRCGTSSAASPSTGRAPSAGT